MRFITTLFLAVFFLTSPALSQTAPVVPAPAGSVEAPDVTVDDLIRLLENDQTRSELLQRLRAQPEGAKAVAESGNETFARRIAEYTKSIAEQAAGAVAATVDVASGVGKVLAGESDIDTPRLQHMISEVALVALALFVGFLFLRLIAVGLQNRIAKHAEGRGWIVVTIALLMATAVDLAAVFLSWGSGYMIALEVIGRNAGRMSINQTLLLNAFLLVELIKVAMRAVLAHRHPALRLIPMGDTTAAYWYFWSARIVSLVGYTFMFVTPIVAATVSYGAAQAIRVLVMATSTVIGVVIVLQNRDSVRRSLSARSNSGRTDTISRACGMLAGYWHFLAIAYLMAILLVWLTNPRDALPFMLKATVNSGIAAGVGALIITFISRFVAVGMRVPDDIRERLPLLQARLNAFVPRVMQIVRTLVLIGIAIAIGQAWGLVDFFAWVSSAEGQTVTGSVLSALLIILIGIGIYIAMASWVEYRLNPNYGTAPTMREKTLLALFRNAFTIALVVMVLMLALAQIGVNIAPLLAGAGVVGLAIGFGAQKFVQDIITGVFIQFENVMNEGDVVEAGGHSGVVEKLTIRSVSIRSLDGTLHLIPFSSVDSVSNMMRGFSFHLAEIGVAYRENVADVKEAMHEAFRLLMKTEHGDVIITDLEMHGVTEFADSAVIIRARIKTLPGAHWAVGRAYNEILKEVFDEREIEMPFPHLTIYAGEDKAGKAPPFRVANIAPPAAKPKPSSSPQQALETVSPQPKQDDDN